MTSESPLTVKWEHKVVWKAALRHHIYACQAVQEIMYHIRQLNIHPWKASLAQGPAVSWWLSRAIEASSLFVTQTSPVLDRIHKKRLRPLFVHLFILESLKVSRSHPRPYSTSWAGAPKLKIYFASVLSQNFGFTSWISHIQFGFH